MFHLIIRKNTDTLSEAKHHKYSVGFQATEYLYLMINADEKSIAIQDFYHNQQ